jgi:hypothetical protein
MKLFIRFSIFISFIILLYLIYRSEIFEEGLRRDYYLLYFLISVFLTIFFIALSNINKEFQKYFVIIFMSILLTLYCFEGYLVLKTNNLQKTNFKVYEDLKKKNPELIPTITPRLYQQERESANYIFSLSGISDVSTIFCNENGYYAIYMSDRYGFNNPDNQWGGANDIEYLLVGDSFTHGACVNRPYDIASILRILSNKKVLNLGYSGNGPLIEYATLREYLDKGVKKVLWLYFEGNDLTNLNNELKYPLLNKYLNDQNFSQNLKSKQNQIDKLARTHFKKREVETNILNNTIIQFITLKNLRNLYNAALETNQVLSPDLQIVIKLADELVKKNNSQLFFIYLPTSMRYKITNPDDVFKKNTIKKIINNLNIPFIDIDDEVFKKEENPLKLFPFFNAHYNHVGYKKVALKIYEKTK